MKEFDNIIGDKLRDLEIQPSARLYSRIEESLAQLEQPATTARRPRVMMLWSYAAAAAVVGIAILFAVRQNNAVIDPVTNTTVINNTQIAAVIPTLPAKPTTSGRSVSDIIRSTRNTSQTAVETLRAEVDPAEMEPVVTSADVDNRVREAINTPSRKRQSRSSNWWDDIWDEDNDNFIVRTIRNSSASLYGGNFGLLSGNMVKNGSTSLSGGRLAAPAIGSANQTFGDRHLSIADRVVEEQLIHRMPVSVGLSVSIPVIKELSLTGGVNYTYLESVSKDSRILTENESRIVRELHYVGLTGALTYIPYQSRYWNLYLSGSISLEKAVYARLTETTNGYLGSQPVISRERFDVNGFQPSLGASAGVMFNITKWLGLYIEPGVAYYFNTGQPTNYRTENPISFSLQVGFRFNWK